MRWPIVAKASRAIGGDAKTIEAALYFTLQRGYLSAEDACQLIGQNVPVYRLLAEQEGIELREALEKVRAKDVKGQDAVDLFLTWMAVDAGEGGAGGSIIKP